MTAVAAHSASAHLRAEGISVAFAEHRVLTDITFTVAAGERAGLIGENGTGKSTLLRVLAGLLEPDAGLVHAVVPGSGAPRIGLLHQQPPFTPTDTVAEAIEAAVAPVRAAERRLQSAATMLGERPDHQSSYRNYDDALSTAERLGVWEIDAQIEATLSGLGLGAVPRGRATGALSGGQQARLSLSWVLLNHPEILLLDEPTNHLDDDAVAYLGTILNSWHGPVLFASHDRAFLDEASTTLLDLDPAPQPHAVTGPLTAGGAGSGIGVTRFTGSYTQYLQARLDARERWWQQYRDEQDQLRRLRRTVRDSHTVGHAQWKPRTETRMAAKFYADRNAKAVSRRVNDAQRRLDQLEESQIRRPPAELSFRGLTSSDTAPTVTAAGPLLGLSEVSVAGRLDSVSLTIGAGEKWLITGPNGAGKSTLLEVIARVLAPTGGALHHPSGLRIGMLAQEHQLADPHQRGSSRTAAETYTDLVGAQQADLQPLSTFGLLAGRDENRRLDELSVGQQRRLALAVVLADPPDLLILDEPTNHFALLLATQLESAIPQYPGAVVVASHDRWLRRRWTGQRLQIGRLGDQPE